MKIAQIAPLAESIPPRLYGGTERVVSWLTEELVRLGHDVTLFASGDSRTRAHLVPIVPQALRLNDAVNDTLGYHILLLEAVRQRAHEFDMLHFHVDLIHGPLLRELGVPAVTTLHGRLDLPDLPAYYREFSDMALVSISDMQRRPMPPVNWAGTVLHGLPTKMLVPTANCEGDYLAFLGRVSPEKRPDRAIEIAARSGIKLKMAAKIDNADRKYWNDVIAPIVAANQEHVEFIGEIGDYEKQEFLGNARALLFPIDWPEPFGLVMIEAMACGTPIIAFRCGSVPEVIDHGRSGFIVNSVEEAVRAVAMIDNLPRSDVRACFEERFTVERMARDYTSLYKEIAKASPDADGIVPLRGSDSAPVIKFA